jgi:hypothetical protein
MMTQTAGVKGITSDREIQDGWWKHTVYRVFLHPWCSSPPTCPNLPRQLRLNIQYRSCMVSKDKREILLRRHSYR